MSAAVLASTAFEAVSKIILTNATNPNAQKQPQPSKNREGKGQETQQDLAASKSQLTPGMPINLTGLMPTSQWTTKQKSRRIVLQPQSRLHPRPSHQTNSRAAANTSSLFKSHEGAPQPVGLKLQPTATSEKPSNYSKSQSAVKRQRSTLWIAKAHLLNMNLSSQAKKVSQNLSVQIAQQKDLSNTQCFASPKGAKTSLRTSHQVGLHHHQSGSPGVFAIGKTKKLSLHQARLTVEKFLKKRVGEQLAIFAKAGVTMGNQKYAIPTAKVGEVFSSIAKGANSRAESKLEIVQMLKAASVNHTSAKAGVAVSKKKKQVGAPNSAARQILSSMGLHLPQSNATPLNVLKPLAQPKSSMPLNSALNFSTVVRQQTGKMAGKYQRRTSQSRLENFDPRQPSSGFSKKAYHLPVHKLKKRLKQHLVNHSLNNFQDSLFNQHVRDSCAAIRQKELKNALNRSKSKSPKKGNSRVSNKPRPLTKRSSNRGKKSTMGQFNEDIRSKAEASRTGDLNVFSSLDSSNLYQNTTSNLNNRIVTVVDEPNDAAKKAQLNYDSETKLIENEPLQSEEDAGVIQSGEDDEDSSEQSVANEEIDPEAAAKIIREFSKLCALQAANGFSTDEGDLISRLSHRSHDNIGYVVSPLLHEHTSSVQDSDENGRKAYSARALNSLPENDEEQQEVLPESSSSDGEYEDFLDESEEGGIPHRMTQIGQEEQEQLMASPQSDMIPSEERNFAQHSRKQLTVPALKAHAFERLGSSKATELSGQVKTKQTATHKDGDHTAGINMQDDNTSRVKNQPQLQNNKNSDVAEWLDPDTENQNDEFELQHMNQNRYYYNSTGAGVHHHHSGTAIEANHCAQQLGTRFVVAQALSKPKSPSNLSMQSHDEDDDFEHDEEDLDDAADYEENVEERLAVPDENISATQQLA